jgi:hypothetical protein
MLTEEQRIDLIYRPDKIWNVVMLQSVRKKDQELLQMIGRGMLAIWLLHWHCVRQQVPWATQAALSKYHALQKPTIDRESTKTKSEWMSSMTEFTDDKGVPLDKPRHLLYARRRDMYDYRHGQRKTVDSVPFESTL